MVSALWEYYVLSALKTVEDIDKWDQSDLDIDSFSLDEDRVLGEGSASYQHAENSNDGSVELNFSPSIDIGDSQFLFLWVKTDNNFADFRLRLDSPSDWAEWRITPDFITKTDSWTVVKLDLSNPYDQDVEIDPKEIQKLSFKTSNNGYHSKINYIVAAKEVFVFETDIAMLLQGLSKNSSASNTNLPILGKTGGATINQGAEDSEFDIPIWLKGENGLQNILRLNNLKNKQRPLLIEIEQYEFYPIMINNISDVNISKEKSETSNLTQIDLTIQANMYNND